MSTPQPPVGPSGQQPAGTPPQPVDTNPLQEVLNRGPKVWMPSAIWVGSSLLLMISLFLPWVKVSSNHAWVNDLDYGVRGWNHGGGLAFILVALLMAWGVARLFVQVKPIYDLLAGALLSIFLFLWLLFSFLRAFSTSNGIYRLVSSSPAWGLYLALLLSLVAIGGAAMLFLGNRQNLTEQGLNLAQQARKTGDTLSTQFSDSVRKATTDTSAPSVPPEPPQPPASPEPPQPPAPPAPPRPPSA